MTVSEPQIQTTVVSLARFRVCGTWLAVPVEHVETVSVLEEVTPLSLFPDHLKGWTTLEGEVFLVLDLARFLNMSDFIDTEEAGAGPQRIVILRSGPLMVAVPVSATGTIVELSTELIHHPDLLNNGRLHEYLFGEADSELGRMGLLDVARVLEAARV